MVPGFLSENHVMSTDRCNFRLMESVVTPVELTVDTILAYLDLLHVEAYM
jgi:hypothetical protein